MHTCIIVVSSTVTVVLKLCVLYYINWRALQGFPPNYEKNCMAAHLKIILLRFEIANQLLTGQWLYFVQ